MIGGRLVTNTQIPPRSSKHMGPALTRMPFSGADVMLNLPGCKYLTMAGLLAELYRHCGKAMNHMGVGALRFCH